MDEGKDSAELNYDYGTYVTFGTYAPGPGETIPEEKQKEYYNKALEVARRATEQQPKNHGAWFNYLMALLLLNRFEEAKNAYKTAVKLSNGIVAVSCHTSRQFINFGLLNAELLGNEMGEMLLKAALKNAPKYAHGWAETAMFYIRMNRADISRDVFVDAFRIVGYEDLLEAIPFCQGNEVEKENLEKLLQNIRTELQRSNWSIKERTEFQDRTREENRLIVPGLRLTNNQVKQILKK